MPYYRTCQICGATLDPGERCDCYDKEKTAQGAANTLSGQAESELSDPFSASEYKTN